MTQGTAGTDGHGVEHPYPTDRLLPERDRSAKVMAAVVGLALAGVLAFAVLFVTMAMLGPRPVP